jgi:hypothetical protein
MLRVMTVAAALCACAPAPARMSAGEASERLELFASGADAMDVCTPQGRALLRGAVRAYGAELAQAGVAWPALPEDGGADMRRVDAAVLVAFGAGMVEMSDFSGPARGAIGRMALTHWPHVREMRAAARVACAEVVELQQAASRFVLEASHYERMAELARGRADAERLRRQTLRMERARTQMNDLAAIVQARLEATPDG